MKPHSHSLLRSILVLTSLAAGCSSVAVHSRTAPNADLGRYRTFAWYSTPGSTAPLTVADQEIRDSLSRSLVQKGISETPQTPDFLVAYHTYFQQNVDANGWGWGWGYDYGWGGPSYYSYTEGTIVVDFIDPTTNKVFWRGTASSVVNDPESVSQAKIDKAVSKLVAKYPVTVTAQSRPPAYR